VAANSYTKLEGQSARHGARSVKFATNPKGKVSNNKNKIRTIEDKEDSDPTSDSSDNTSIYKVGTVNGRATDVQRRPVRTVKIDNKDINVLIDTGATANIMDEEAYRKIYPGQQKLKKAKSIMQPYHTGKNPTPPLCIVGKFDPVI
jgi:translation elongation factor P/translation initiation factor 5A